MFSEADCDDGSDMAARGLAGLKRPGDEAGVLFAVLEGGCGSRCRVLSWYGVPSVAVWSGPGWGSILSSRSWDRVVVRREVVAANRHNELEQEGPTEATKLAIER